jgi:hypothetical protein
LRINYDDLTIENRARNGEKLHGLNHIKKLLRLILPVATPELHLPAINAAEHSVAIEL